MIRKTVALFASVLLLSCTATNDTATFTLKGSGSASASVTVKSSTGGSPTYLAIKQYAIWLSTSADCSNPVSVADYGATPTQFDFFENPTLFQGTPPDGTYHCMIMKQKDTMGFKADAAAVAANVGCDNTVTVYWFDTYRHNEDNDGDWKDINGVAIDATGSVATPGEDTVYYFASTDPTQLNLDPGSVITLASPLTVPGEVTFYIDFTNQVSSSDSHCWLEQPVIGFR